MKQNKKNLKIFHLLLVIIPNKCYNIIVKR